MSQQDVQIIGRVLKFQENRNGDALRIAIVFDPAQPDGRAQAGELVGLLGTGQSIGNLSLKGVLVEQGKLANLVGVDAIFAAAGSDAGLLKSAGKRLGVPCITRDLEQVTQGACTVAIQSAPTIAIYFNSANATASGVRFATAFVMMVHEL